MDFRFFNFLQKKSQTGNIREIQTSKNRIEFKFKFLIANKPKKKKIERDNQEKFDLLN